MTFEDQSERDERRRQLLELLNPETEIERLRWKLRFWRVFGLIMAFCFILESYFAGRLLVSVFP